jgi:hypothetical protein
MSIPFGAAIMITILTGCNTARVGVLQHDVHTIPLDKSESMHAEVKMGAGELNLSGGSKNLADLDFAYNVAGWKSRVRYSSTGTHGDLDVEQGDSPSAAGDAENRWDVKLNDGVLTDLTVELGAGQAALKLGSMRLRDVNVQIGAGELDVDLRGTPASSYNVRIEGGAGSATVFLPANARIFATASGGIGSIQVDGLEERGGHWINPRGEHSPVTVRLEVRGGVGEIRLIAE